MGKYDPLRIHLESLETERWRASFEEIEEILGFQLPASARQYQAWWANETETKKSQKLAWGKAGWRTDNLNLTGETIEFVRAGGNFRRRREMPAQPQRQRPNCWLDDILVDLAGKRPIFHSEADFQHALAWAIHEVSPDLQMRLEYRPFLGERMYLDIWLGGEQPVVLELKYPTRALDVTVDEERFALKNQAAQDLTRYDFLKDVARVEHVKASFPGASGYALLLTNDRSYWTTSGQPDTIDSAFRLHEGRNVKGDLNWAAHAGKGTTKGREQPVSIGGTYHLNWRRYSVFGEGTYSEFRYLLVSIE